METLTIQELSHRTGLSSAALRFYESKGLLSPVGRTSGMRIYESDAINHLALIDLLKLVGFTLTEIGTMLDADGRVREDWRTMVDAKVNELTLKIDELSGARSMLTHSLDCPHPSVSDCPIFQGGVTAHAARLGQSPS